MKKALVLAMVMALGVSTVGFAGAKADKAATDKAAAEKAAAKEAGVEFDAKATKAEVIEAVIAAEKYADLV